MRLLLLPFLACCLLAACDQSRFPVTAAEHTAATEAWQQQRADGLRAENGWLTLVALYWLQPGENDFGAGSNNDFVLLNDALPEHAGTFVYRDGEVAFRAAPKASVTLHGEVVQEVAMIDDQHDETTVLATKSLRFYVIERAGRHGIRVRDLTNPERMNFEGLAYFPVSLDWRKEARFVPWPEKRAVKIINILGMVDEMASPGELVFEHEGAEFRVTALAEAGDEQWFVMIADGTSGRETYGAGRYLYIDPPVEGVTLVDFNRAYNPPCAFTALATCPLPPASNRLSLRITAGEKNYAGGQGWHAGAN